MQRWQLTFERGEELRYIGHLDLSRTWLRAIRRAGIALVSTQGFRPHPKMAFAAALPVGVTGRAELLDLSVAEELPAEALRERVAAQLPAGLALSAVTPLDGPALAARLRYAEYRATLACTLSYAQIGARVKGLLVAAELPRTRALEKGIRQYDLRPLIADLWVERWDEEQVIGMRLRADGSGAGRPDEVLATLDLGEAQPKVERTRLILAATAPER